MLRAMLTKGGYDAVLAHDGNEAWKLLQDENPPRMAILDWMMPGMDGVELCRRIRAMAREPYIYILLLTSRTEAQDLIEGMEAGADDYLTKPFNTHELRVRLRAGMRILDLQEELLLAREALREQATHDALTGLLNRGAILEALQTQLSRSAREERPAAVLLVDLDCFKMINDTRGHLAGDAVLREAAQRMKSAVRRYDSVGRYGGEEFLIVLPGCSGGTAVQHAERIRHAVGGQPYTAGGERFSITCSIGVSWRDQPAAHHADCLIREADLLLYRAKDLGRNCVCTKM
jgi:two-component system, cell cycle response regulator